MKTVAMRGRQHNRRNGRTPDPVAARKIVEEALAYNRTHQSPLDGLTAAQIMARIKKTRYELFKERFAPRSR